MKLEWFIYPLPSSVCETSTKGYYYCAYCTYCINLYIEVIPIPPPNVWEYAFVYRDGQRVVETGLGD